MKPAPFEYFIPESIDQALDHLSEYGYDAKPLAGGQSLIPMMNFRLAQPSMLVDLNRLGDLSYIAPSANGGVRIGAMTRHHMVEHDRLIAERAPLVHGTMPRIASAPIRSRGTFGGSIAHADPAAELASVCVALEGRFRLQSTQGERWVPASEFFVGMFTTLLEPEELLVEIELPPPGVRSGWSLQEVVRRASDFALVGVVSTVTLGESGAFENVRIVLMSVGDGPVVAREAAGMLIGQMPEEGSIHSAAEAVKGEIDPGGDIHASAEFRRHLSSVLTLRALEEAVRRAKGEAQ
jgi:CO/xanthine dehydrogenase FAD-binding subunit